MTLARRAADAVARNHGRDPWSVARRLRLRVRRSSLPSPHRELYVQQLRGRRRAGLAIAKDASREEARELVAHGIAHHLLHAGDRVTGGSTAVWSGRHEREADDFAAYLLIPAWRFRELAGEDSQADVADLSDRCSVSEGLARRRLRLN